jgi:hypothetical protein
MKLVLILLTIFKINLIKCGYLFVLPRPEYQTNKVVASIDDSFFISCRMIASSNDKENPNLLQWRSPSNQIITSDSNERIYTQPFQDKLRLYFDKLLTGDAGNYTCVDVISNEIKLVDLVIIKKISFYDTPTDQLINPNQSNHMVKCKVSAYPEPEIDWFRQNMTNEFKSVYDDDDQNKYTISDQGLLIANPQPEDEGVYYCQAYVPLTGEVKKIAINVEMMQSPKWINDVPKDIEVIKGNNVIINCKATAKPLPVYMWTRNGAPLDVNGENLIIPNLDYNDTANYSCKAENSLGKIEASIRLIVLVAPEIESILINDDDANVIEGNNAYLRCFIRESYPKGIIEWKYSDTQQNINDTDLIKITFYSNYNNRTWSELKLLNVTRFHKRNYTCVAKNKLGIVEQQAELFIEYPPKLVFNDEAKKFYYSWFSSNISYPVVFTCVAVGEPKPFITWLSNGQKIDPDNIKYRLLRNESGISKLEIRPRILADFDDEYKCLAENRHGNEESKIDLRLAKTPKFAPSIQFLSVNPDSVILSINSSAIEDIDDVGMPIEAYKIQWIFNNSEWTKPNEKEIPVILTNLTKSRNLNTYNVEIDSLIPDTKYSFRVAAVNKPGLGVWSHKQVKTSPPRQPNPIKVISQEICQVSTTCNVEWTIIGNCSSSVIEYLIRWRRIGYKNSLNKYISTYKKEQWSSIVTIKEPVRKYMIMNLEANSIYEVDILARNDFGLSASQLFSIRTLQPGIFLSIFFI